MKRQFRSHSRMSKALTDPKPELVSLVKTGANKTPFRALRATGDDTVEEETMSEVSIKADTHDIVCVDFASAQFPTETAVKAWLDDGGYSDYAIETTDTGFRVASKDADIAADGVVAVDMGDKGLTVHVKTVAPGGDTGIVAPEDTSQKSDALSTDNVVHPGAETPTVEGMDVLTQRCCGCYDVVESTYGKGDTLADVIANNFNGVPPGMLDIVMALYDAIRNNLMSGDAAGAKAVIAEFGSKMDALIAIFPGTEQASLRAFVDAIAPAVDVNATEDTTMKTEETPAAVVDVVATPAADAAPAVAEETAAKAEEVPAANAVEAEPVPTPMDALTALVAKMAGTIDTLAGKVSDMETSTKASIDETTQRVAAVEDVRQTRKGADVDETGQAVPVVASKSAETVSELRTRSVLGMRKPV